MHLAESHHRTMLQDSDLMDGDVIDEGRAVGSSRGQGHHAIIMSDHTVPGLDVRSQQLESGQWSSGQLHGL